MDTNIRLSLSLTFDLHIKTFLCLKFLLSPVFSLPIKAEPFFSLSQTVDI